MPAVVSRAFAASHVAVLGGIFRPAVDASALSRVSVCRKFASSGPVIRHENQDGVVGHAFRFEEFKQSSQVPVEVGHHSFETGQTVAHAHVEEWLLPLLSDQVRAMRGVRRQVNEERFAAPGIGSHRRHERHGLVKPDVGAVAVELLPAVAVEVRVVEIVVRPEVGNLSQTSAAMPD